MEQRAVRLFPMGITQEQGAVLHARQKWVDSVKYLRDRKGESRWLLDRPVTRKHYVHRPHQFSMFSLMQRQIKGAP